MDEEDRKFSLSATFKKVAKHLLSPTMIIMMAIMAFPAIAAAVPAGTATFGDLLMGTVDMYSSMLMAPFTDGGIVVDAVSNAAGGEWAASSYEMGTMHSMHGGEHIVHDTPGGKTMMHHAEP